MPRRRSTHLVSQHLERISRKVLEKYQDTISDYIRGRHGIYALYRKDKLYYVGLARNMRSRLKAHLRDKHGSSWDRFSVYLVIDHDHIKELESLVLRMVSPKGNAVKGKIPRSENLLKKLKKDMQARFRQETHELLGKTSRRSKRKGARRAKPPVGDIGRYVDGPFKLRADYKGKVLRARVRPDGQVRWNNKVYKSPTAAAGAAVKGRRNGWRFWHYERGPGDWVQLAELKKTTRPKRKKAGAKTKRKKTKAARTKPAIGIGRYVDRPLKLRADYKGKVYRARVRADGQVRWNKKVYKSPTAAAGAVVKGRRNGWRFWHYQRAPGDWVQLTELRRSRRKKAKKKRTKTKARRSKTTTAAKRAAATRRKKNALKKKRSAAAKKAVATRRKNKAQKTKKKRAATTRKKKTKRKKKARG